MGTSGRATASGAAGLALRLLPAVISAIAGISPGHATSTDGSARAPSPSYVDSLQASRARVIELYRHGASRIDIASALAEQGELAIIVGDVEQARHALSRSVRLLEQVGDDDGRKIRAIAALSMVDAIEGNRRLVAQRLEQAQADLHDGQDDELAQASLRSVRDATDLLAAPPSNALLERLVEEMNASTPDAETSTSPWSAASLHRHASLPIGSDAAASARYDWHAAARDRLADAHPATALAAVDYCASLVRSPSFPGIDASTARSALLDLGAAIATLQKQLGPRHPALPVAWSTSAALSWRLGKSAEAVTALERAASIAATHHDGPNLAVSLDDVARGHWMMDQRDVAIFYAKAALLARLRTAEASRSVDAPSDGGGSADAFTFLTANDRVASQTLVSWLRRAGRDDEADLLAMRLAQQKRSANAVQSDLRPSSSLSQTSGLPLQSREMPWMSRLVSLNAQLGSLRERVARSRDIGDALESPSSSPSIGELQRRIDIGVAEGYRFDSQLRSSLTRR